MKTKIAVVGATGLVGQMMFRVMEERGLTDVELIAVASARSQGKKLLFNGNEIEVIRVEEAIKARPDIALFSAGSDFSLRYAKQFAETGCIVIDNSSAWRMDDSVPLLVPEINLYQLKPEHRIIANPNCSTIQLVMVLACLQAVSPIRRIVVSTYQSVSGSGLEGIQQLEVEEAGKQPSNPAYPHAIHRNVIPHGGAFDEKGNTAEELKLVFETRKILQQTQLAVTSTVVRVPVIGGHSMSVNIEFENAFDLDSIREAILNCPTLILQDNPQENIYPMPLFAQDKDEVFVGRLRVDESIAHGLNLWIVADNLRKGAATNAIQIAMAIMDRKRGIIQ